MTVLACLFQLSRASLLELSAKSIVTPDYAYKRADNSLRGPGLN